MSDKIMKGSQVNDSQSIVKGQVRENYNYSQVRVYIVRQNDMTRLVKTSEVRDYGKHYKVHVRVTTKTDYNYK